MSLTRCNKEYLDEECCFLYKAVRVKSTPDMLGNLEFQMEILTPEVLKSMPEADLRAYFGQWVAEERSRGLIDIKFALTNDGNSTVTDVMRQLLIIKHMKANAQLERYTD